MCFSLFDNYYISLAYDKAVLAFVLSKLYISPFWLETAASYFYPCKRISWQDQLELKLLLIGFLFSLFQLRYNIDVNGGF